MAGETAKSAAICLSIVSWSRTSHVVSWLTPSGKLSTVVKGAVRGKSLFLGQYDLNYTCEIVYYLRARRELHALRECWPVELREYLRGDFRAIALAGYYRRVISELVPAGDDASEWFGLLSRSLDALRGVYPRVSDLVAFDMQVLGLAGLSPLSDAATGRLLLRGERQISVSPEILAYLRNPDDNVKNSQIPLDAARVIGVFYQFHLDCAFDGRRTVLEMLRNNN